MASAAQYKDDNDTPNLTRSSYLTYEQVSNMRVRDLKRRLTLVHGFGADEVSSMLDKKELIQALAFEEEKIRLQQSAQFQRVAIKNTMIVIVLTIVVLLCWPMLRHVYEVASVNLLVYWDRKTLEATRCMELQTYWGILGVLLMGLVDILQLWLTASVILSWVTTSKYFFPVPQLSVKPAALMGGELAQSKAANYGINMGSMAITWLLRFCNGRLQHWTGLAMAQAAKRQRVQRRQNETPEERAARKAAKQARKQQSSSTAATTATTPDPQEPSNVTEPTATPDDLPTCELDEMD